MSKRDFPENQYSAYDPTLTAQEYVELKLTGTSYYYSEQIDAVKDQTEALARLLPKLIGALYDKGLLTKEEVMELI